MGCVGSKAAGSYEAGTASIKINLKSTPKGDEATKEESLAAALVPAPTSEAPKPPPEEDTAALLVADEARLSEAIARPLPEGSMWLALGELEQPRRVDEVDGCEVRLELGAATRKPRAALGEGPCDCLAQSRLIGHE